MEKMEPDQEEKLYVVLEQACLEVTDGSRRRKSERKGKEYYLLNSEDHADILKKANKDPALYRPDILHYTLLTLLDSPLNKAGKLQILIRTTNKVLIKVNPAIRIPRTYKRFAGLITQLLTGFKIRAQGSSEVLMEVKKNILERHIPVGS